MWQIESQHVDLAEMEHVTVFVEPNVSTRNGEPARHLLQIRLGDHYQVNDEGHLMDEEGNVYDHRAKQQDVLSELEQRHQNARRFAQRHRLQIYKGPQ